MKELLCFNDVSFTYYTKENETDALKNISFCINENEFLSIVGPSGCGKSTILSLISGLIPPTLGRIFIEDCQVLGASNDIGYMLQKDHLFDWRTIRENVMLGLEIRHKKTEENMQYADVLLEKYGLKDFVDHYPRQLSGGMRQRVALIRTLATMPKILLLDEPFSALDYQTRLNVCDDVYQIIKEEKKSTVLVTHDIAEAISISDRIIVLTQRPASIKNMFTLDILKDSPLKRRENTKFPVWFDRIWNELNNESIM